MSIASTLALVATVVARPKPKDDRLAEARDEIISLKRKIKVLEADRDSWRKAWRAQVQADLTRLMAIEASHALSFGMLCNCVPSRAQVWGVGGERA